MVVRDRKTPGVIKSLTQESASGRLEVPRAPKAENFMIEELRQKFEDLAARVAELRRFL